MPFDGKEYPVRERMLQKLDKVQNLLATEDRWCKGALRTRDGRRCVVGALLDARARSLLYSVIVTAARDVTGLAFSAVEQFNDYPATNHRLVVAVLADARRKIMIGAAPPDTAAFLRKAFGAFFHRAPSSPPSLWFW